MSYGMDPLLDAWREYDAAAAAAAAQALADDVRAAEIASVRSVTTAIKALHPALFTPAAVAQIVAVLTGQVDKANGWLVDDKEFALAAMSDLHDDLEAMQ